MNYAWIVLFRFQLCLFFWNAYGRTHWFYEHTHTHTRSQWNYTNSSCLLWWLAFENEGKSHCFLSWVELSGGLWGNSEAFVFHPNAIMNDDLPQCACNQRAQHKTLSECEQIKLNFCTIGFEFKVFLCLFYFLATLRFIEFRCFFQLSAFYLMVILYKSV